MAETGLYQIKLVVGRVGTPGAPILHIQGTVESATGIVNAMAEITQAVPPPDGDIKILHVLGRVRHTGFGKDDIFVTLNGRYLAPEPPGVIAVYYLPFDAILKVDKSWNGTGSYSYGKHHVEDVPVKSES